MPLGEKELGVFHKQKEAGSGESSTREGWQSGQGLEHVWP